MNDLANTLVTLNKEMKRKYAYEFGKRWNVKTPRYSIKRWVSTLNVCVTKEEIADKLFKTIDKSPNKEEYTPAIRRQCLRYALICHERDRALWRKVTLGI